MKSVSKIIFFVFLASLFASCSSVREVKYDSGYPLTTETAQSLNRKLSVSVPEGWFTAEDNECKCRDIWLLKNDYSASISFTRISADSLTLANAKGEKLSEIKKLSQDFKRIKYSGQTEYLFEDEIPETSGKKFLAYKFKDDQNHIARTAVFELDGVYYECTVIAVNNDLSSDLMRVQNSVLQSVK